MPVVLGFPGDGNSCDLDCNVQIPGQLPLPEGVLGRAAGGREHPFCQQCSTIISQYQSKR